jgi:hypothetical protein
MKAGILRRAPATGCSPAFKEAPCCPGRCRGVGVVLVRYGNREQGSLLGEHPDDPGARVESSIALFCTTAASTRRLKRLGTGGHSSTSRFTNRPADKPFTNPEDAPVALLKAKRASARGPNVGLYRHDTAYSAHGSTACRLTAICTIT